jgi:hypothetical protein
MRRSVRFCPVLAVLALAPAAAAGGGPSPGIARVLTESGVRYAAVPAAEGTTTLTRSGAATRTATLPGRWGIPRVTYSGAVGGLSHDGSTLVLAEAPPGNGALRSVSRFAVLDAATLRPLKTIRLRGDFSFDALSPTGRTLYMTKHVDQEDLSRYVVKAYDVARGRLYAAPVADKTQLGWVMGGYPVARVESADGRWAYTLYQRGGGMPFVHALDTVNRAARCIGLAWPYTRSQDVLGSARLQVAGRKLEIATRAGERLFSIDTNTFEVRKG